MQGSHLEEHQQTALQGQGVHRSQDWAYPRRRALPQLGLPRGQPGTSGDRAALPGP